MQNITLTLLLLFIVDNKMLLQDKYDDVTEEKVKFQYDDSMPKNALDSSNKLKTIVFYNWGLASFNGSTISDLCEDSLHKKYGFTYLSVGSCMEPFYKKIRWRMHNKNSERKMKKRLGENWRLVYKKEFDSCYSKKQIEINLEDSSILWKN